MKYQDFIVYGFPRSGQHYLTALIARNFFDDSHYAGMTGAHGLESKRLGRAGSAVFYITRRFRGVAESIFKLRDALGLRARSIEELKRRPVEEMYDKELTGDVDLNNLVSVQRINKGGKSFRNFKGTLEAVWRAHIKAWTELVAQHENAHLVSYRELRVDFQAEMLKIAQFLGSGRTEFENIRERVGWYPPGATWSKGE